MAVTREQYGILRRPLDTEKNSKLREKGVYVFEVDLKANKHEIAQAVRDVFNVKVAKVRTVVVKGRKNLRTRTGYHNESNRKKALVTLEKGQEIQLT
ncbi:MAG: 50S ribosomal protein L23 [Planctomycetes bacterium]|nr:50S ribosomal protein L23 [Planctomycetota bacterium]